MSDLAFTPEVRTAPIPVGELLPWAIFAGLILLLAIYFVGAEQGATSLISGMYVHEFVHDGRHLLGFPCHWATMVGSLLLRGMLVGIVAAVVAFGFAKVFGGPRIDEAIAGSG
jgi:hypothetical protein